MDLPLLNAVQTAVADTVVALQPARDAIAQAADIAVLVAAAALTVVAVYVVMAMAQIRGTLREVRRAMHQNLGPVSDRARSISENVQFITQAVRTDVQRLHASVKALTARLHQASDRMEERIEEFNALMEVVQTEAEDIFLDTAATVRGVREGARSLASREPEALPDAGQPADVDELPAPLAKPPDTPALDETYDPLADEAALPADR